jgi:hypothetical protein
MRLMDIVILSMTEEYQEQVRRYVLMPDCYQMMLIVMIYDDATGLQDHVGLMPCEMDG